MINITVAKAMSKLKIYDKRMDAIILKLKETTSEMYQIGPNKKTREIFTHPCVGALSEVDMSNNDLKQDKISEYKKFIDEIKQIITNRDKVKRAITLSNASTEIILNGKKITIAEAIDIKNHLKKRGELISAMEQQLIKTRRRRDSNNTEIDMAVLSIRDSNDEHAEEVKMFISMWEKRKMALFDPAGFEQMIADEIKDFEFVKEELDYLINSSNATTMIDVDIDE